jgi:hypothetical protein
MAYLASKIEISSNPEGLNLFHHTAKPIPTGQYWRKDTVSPTPCQAMFKAERFQNEIVR